ncbi:hypothetical protein J6590_027190 [Homalodisca vitripennis]|nr:hypothetical protein J6590_027190 [Homalodisca vitripennis]
MDWPGAHTLVRIPSPAPPAPRPSRPAPFRDTKNFLKIVHYPLPPARYFINGRTTCRRTLPGRMGACLLVVTPTPVTESECERSVARVEGREGVARLGIVSGSRARVAPGGGGSFCGNKPVARTGIPFSTPALGCLLSNSHQFEEFRPRRLESDAVTDLIPNELKMLNNSKAQNELFTSFRHEGHLDYKIQCNLDKEEFSLFHREHIRSQVCDSVRFQTLQ